MKIDRVGVPSTMRHCGLSLSCWAWLGAALCAMAVIVIAWSYRDDWGIAVGLLAVMIVPFLAWKARQSSGRVSPAKAKTRAVSASGSATSLS